LREASRGWVAIFELANPIQNGTWVASERLPIAAGQDGIHGVGRKQALLLQVEDPAIAVLELDQEGTCAFSDDFH
jgi:hypothetical protein